VSPLLLELLLSPAAHAIRVEHRLRLILAHETPDPNRSRLLLVKRAQAGMLAAA